MPQYFFPSGLTKSFAIRLVLLWAGAQVLCLNPAVSATARYRLTWRDDPSTTMVIGFQQYGNDGGTRVVYDVQPFGQNEKSYRFRAAPARRVERYGMTNVFVRLSRLRPATQYYFLIIDGDGASRQMSFETAPGDPSIPLSIIAGGDSRNNRSVAQQANRLVSSLRPHFVLFGGDMTTNDSPGEWAAWLDDWQLTTSTDGRLTPIVPARGNHEEDNKSIYDIFDVSSPDITYSLTFGGNLLRVYTLNSLNPPGGAQVEWLSRDLTGCRTQWKMAQYHHAMRPHTSVKPEQDALVHYWAPLFHNFGMNLVVESDGHVVKNTWPIRPSKEPGNDHGFVRDEERGTVYVGEGCWGAPLRHNNDDKSWTRASGQFNQFKWIWVSKDEIQLRTVMINRSQNVRTEVIPTDRFRSPAGMYYWDGNGTGDVLRLPRRDAPAPSGTFAPRAPAQATSADGPPTLVRSGSNLVVVNFTLPAAGPVDLMVVDRTMKMLWRTQLPPRGPGPYTERVQLPELPRTNVQLIVKCASGVIGKFELR